MARDTHKVEVHRYRRDKGLLPAADDVAAEEPLEIRVGGRSVSITMRTPGHDEELASGFLLSEGLIQDRADVAHVHRCDQSDHSAVDVVVASRVAVDFARLTRHVFASSSCGICGAATIDAVRKHWPAAANGPGISADVLISLPQRLRDVQAAFERTGGLHAAGLFEAGGRLVVAREDVGRHNAVDKVLGHALLAGLTPLNSHVLMVSGRASFEIVQKALAAGTPIVAAVSAPSSLAVELAEDSNITLVGFLREDRFNVYTHPSRIRTTHAGEIDTATTL
ncbi:Sulfur carrier protein FdhD [Phycisphaerales bacterium]|nr:Sulfur carrier protein FdhD [Phycisphaerales bacterium]